MLIGRGTFTAGMNHTMRGTFSLTKEDGGIEFLTSEDFFFDGSPEPGWGLYKGIPTDRLDPVLQATMRDTRFGELPEGIVPISGTQRAIIPPMINLDEFDTIVLWCFDVPFILGTGPIERTFG